MKIIQVALSDENYSLLEAITYAIKIDNEHMGLTHVASTAINYGLIELAKTWIRIQK